MKKILSLFLALIMVMSLFNGVTVSAAVKVASGECGDNVNWVLDNEGLLTISGEGKMRSYNYYGDTFLYRYWDSVKSIDIENGVTSIGRWVFGYCTSLTEIVIPDSVTSIGYYAFSSCDSLTDVYYTGTEEEWNEISVATNNEDLLNATIHFNYSMPEKPSDKIIDSGLCGDEGDNAIWTLDSEGLLTISGEGFMDDFSYNGAPWDDYNTYIKNVIIEKGIREIGSYAFADCTVLNSIEVPDSVTSVGASSFRNCTSLTTIKIPVKVMTIGSYAFNNCTSLTSVEFSNKVEYIHSYAFGGCTNLTDVYYDGVEIQWDSMTIDSFNTPLVYANIHFIEVNEPIIISSGECGDQGNNVTWTLDSNGLLKISGEGKFKRCCNGRYQKEIKAVIIEEGITNICESAFYDFVSLASIEIPNSITEIGRYAFGYCKSLTTIEIPDSVTSVGYYAFYGCSALTDVYYGGSPMQWKTVEIGWFNQNLTNANIHFAKVASGTCGDNLTWTLDENGLLTISGTGKMNDYSSSSGPWYSYNESVKSVNIEDGVTSIGNHAFYDCGSLTSVTIPDSVTSIGNYAFSWCKSLTEITIPDGVTIIREYTFSNCGSLTGVTIPDSVTRIDEHAFAGCKSLTEITIPDSVTLILDYAFADCDSLTEIIIPDSVTDIYEYTFFECDALTSVIIPDSVTNIRAYAFCYCDSLTDVHYGGTKAQWNEITIGSYNERLTNANIHFPFVAPAFSFEIDTLTLAKNGAETVKVGVAYIGDQEFEVGVDNWNEFVAKGRKYMELNGYSAYVSYDNTFERKTYKTKGNYVAFVKYTDFDGVTRSDYFTFAITEGEKADYTIELTDNKFTMKAPEDFSYKMGVAYVGPGESTVDIDNWNDFIKRGKSYGNWNGSAGYVLYVNSCPTKTYVTSGNYAVFVKYLDPVGKTVVDYYTFNIPAFENPVLEYADRTLTLDKNSAKSAKVGVAYIGDQEFEVGKDNWNEFVEMGSKYKKLNGEGGYVLYSDAPAGALRTYNTLGNYVAFVKYQGDRAVWRSEYMTFTVK